MVSKNVRGEEEEVSEEHTTHNTPTYGTYETDQEFEEPADRMIAETRAKTRKLGEKVLRDYEEMKEIKQWLHSGKSTDDKEIETTVAKMHELENKLERDKKEWEENFESVDPIGFNEFKIDLLRARDKFLSNDSATRDKISDEIEELQLEKEAILQKYEEMNEDWHDTIEEPEEEILGDIMEEIKSKDEEEDT